MTHKKTKALRTAIKTLALTIGLAGAGVLSTALILANEIPDSLSVVAGKQLEFADNLPIKAELTGSDYIEADTGGRVGRHFHDELKIFGAVVVKDVSVSVVKETYVIPSGTTFGVKFYTAGVVVVGMTDVDTASGPQNPAYTSGIRAGDVILAINGTPVSTNAEVSQIFSASDGKTLDVSLKRGELGFRVSFKAAFSVSEDAYKAGMWVRDSTAGIGTLTYFDPSSSVFGGLGHGICDIDTGKIMPLLSGDVVRVNMSGITKGSKGQPGELQGTLDDSVWGSLYTNTETGVYGILQSGVQGKSVAVAMKQEVSEGPAQIIATVDSTGPKLYSVDIEKIHFNDDSPTKNMIVLVTDQNLICKTGGIVQGMSGCPILQNGKLVGAVTHVFVNDPLRGYGIFAENMINTANTLEIYKAKDVS